MRASLLPGEKPQIFPIELLTCVMPVHKACLFCMLWETGPNSPHLCPPALVPILKSETLQVSFPLTILYFTKLQILLPDSPTKLQLPVHRLNPGDCLSYLSTWLGHGTQIFAPTLF